MDLQQLKEGGTFRGRYLDSFGHQCNITLALEVEGERLGGKFQMTLISEDDPAQRVEGVVSGRGKEGRLSMEIQLGAKREESMQLACKLVEAGSYARACLMGEVLEGPQNFGGGVWIAWHFNK